jgi:hypothetical protein
MTESTDEENAKYRKSMIQSELIPFLLHLSQGAAMIALRNKVNITVPLIRQAFDKEPHVIGRIDLSLLLPVFPLLSAANHAFALGEIFSGRAGRVGPDGVQSVTESVKWIEYGISASVMLWLISSLSGILDLRSLVSIVVSNCLLQYLGSRIEKDAIRGHRNSLLMLIAWVVHFSIWTQIVMAFYGAIAETKTTKPVPGIVYGIVWVMFSLFSGFGIWSLIVSREGRGMGKKSGELRKDRIGYNTLSVVSKSVLMWMVFFGLKNAELPIYVDPPLDTTDRPPNLKHS